MDEIYELQRDYYSSSLSVPPPPPPAPPNLYYSSYYFYNSSNPLGTTSFRDGRGGVPLSDGSSEPSSLFASSSCPAVSTDSGEEISTAMIKAKISSHPLYPKLLQSYIDCQKVGAAPDIMQMLDEIWREKGGFYGSRYGGLSRCFDDDGDADPELDDFMETYCKVLEKLKWDLGRPMEEASQFLSSMETQLTNLLCNSTIADSSAAHTRLSSDVSSEEDISGSESTEMLDFQQRQQQQHNGEDVDHLKNKLLRKYSGYLTSLKQEFSKKKKKGKLPPEATTILLDWWNVHYKWPYPTESDKVALVESTGLDQKQINNWFINQRKRHWKPSESTSFAVVDSVYGPLFTSN